MSTPTTRRQRLQRLCLSAPLLVIGVLLLALSAASTHAFPTPVQIFYVTEPEDDIFTALDLLNNETEQPMYTMISIAIGEDGTYIYYDQWEDGFANDIANPTGAEIYSGGNPDGVQIWGDGNTANGAPPNIPSDVLNGGDVILLQNNVGVPNTAASVEFDGKDKIGATNAVAVSRSIWSAGAGAPQSLLAYANAMFATTEWGQSYTAPVGCDTTGDGDMFEYAAFSVTAAYDDTTVEFDANNDGIYETSVVLDEGETAFNQGVNNPSGCDYVRQGGKVRSTDPDKPIQVILLTGDVSESYEGRDLNLIPDAQLGSSYFMPVGVDESDSGEVQLFIYNPGNSNLFVRCEAADGPDAGTAIDTWDLTIAAGAINSTVLLDDNQAVHCFAVTAAGGTTPDTSRAFSGVATVDSNGTGSDAGGQGRTYDWGVPFIPESGLSNQALVGLGLGRDPNSATNPDENGSPIWVTPTCQTFFYVDWDNDGTADKVDFNGDGDVTDTNVNGLNETTSGAGFQVPLLQSVRLFDPDGDQTGGYIYTRTASGGGGSGGCSFAAAWGEDPTTASATQPGMDLGTIIVALRSVETSKESELVTDADNSGSITPGDTIRYVITVENTGLSPFNVTVADDIPTNTSYVLSSTAKDVGAGFVAVADDGVGTPFPLDGAGLALGSLPEGDTWQVRFSVTVNSLPAGQTVDITNCAQISYGSSLVETCKTNSVTVPAAPVLTLDKTTTTGSYNAVGATINYSYKVTNGGTVPLTPPYAVSDNKATVTCPQTPNPLNPNAFITCTASYTVTQADLDAGSVTNIATATAKYGADTVTSNQDTVTVPAVQNLALTLDKITLTANYDEVGDVINYSYLVTNTGNVSLTPAYAVSDNKATVTCPQTPNPLIPGGSITCTASHTVTQADLDAGSVTNVATATAKHGTDTVTSNTDTETVPALRNPLLTLEKSTTTADYDEVGDPINYSYKVTNSGNVSLTPPYAVSDNKAATVTCPQTPNPLPPGGSITCTATYLVTQADIDAGSVHNTAVATAKDGANTVTSNQDDVTVPAIQSAALALDKSTTTLNYDNAGDTISYSYLVTNSGNVALTPPYAVSDNKTTVTCPQTPNPLMAGGSITCTATYVVTQADVDAGSVVNMATATAKHGTDTVTSNQDTVTVPALQGPALTLEKSTTTLSYNSVGNTINYSYKVTNSGNVSLTPPYAVSDNKAASVSCPQTPNPLPPGGSITCTASYVVTQADINAGSVTNVAQATAKHGTDTVTSNQDDVTVPAIQNPQLTLDKSTTTVNYDSVGDTISYSYLVTNSGNVSLTPPYAVSDNKTTVTCPQTPNPLNPGASITCTATYVVTQADINAGSVANTATATAKHGTDTVTSNTDTVTVPALQLPSLHLDKTTTTANYDSVGDTIHYNYLVMNDGNVPLTPPYAVSDNKAPSVTCPQTPNPLNPGASITCTASYVVTLADLYAGSVTNVAQATARYGNDTVPSNEDTVNVPALILDPCPPAAAGHTWTDILGIGMGKPTAHKNQAKVVIPNSANLVSLYAQLAAKDQGHVKYVRFIYPNNTFIQMNVPTSPPPLNAAVFWYGAQMNPTANVRGRWFLNPTGTKAHVPRALIVYPTYNDPAHRYVNVFKVWQTSETQVYWDVANGWTPARHLTIDIAAPLMATTFNVEVALVDNDKDARPIDVTVKAGNVSVTQSPINPNKGDQLNIMSFTLPNVPARTSQITIDIVSRGPNVGGLGALGGDSGAITGTTANYMCANTTP